MAQERRSTLGLFAAAIAFLLPVLYSPSLRSEFWTAKAALVLLVGAVGLPRLVAMVRGTARAPAVLALGLVGTAGLSAAAADRPALAAFGLYNLGTGALFVASLAGVWAIGASLNERERREVLVALSGALALNVVAALAGLAFDLDFLRVDPPERSSGLLGNPVQLGSLLAAGLALLGPWFLARPRLAWAGLFGGAVALQLAGGRFSLVIGVVVALVTVRAWPRRAAALFLGVLVLGLATGGLLAAWSGRASSSSRLAPAAAAGSGQARVATWWSARRAVVDRPALGVGPGQFRSATSKDRTEEIALAEGPERLFSDAHNLVVEYGVTTGLVGLAALAAWLATALRRARGPLLVFSVGLLAHHLVQPQSVGTTPIMFLALGAAGTAIPVEGWRWPGRAGLCLAAPAIAAAMVLLVGDFRMEQARLDFALSHAEGANSLLPHWPEPAQLVARVKAYQSIVERDPAKLSASRRWLETAAGRDPTDPALWNDLADLELKDGDISSAERHYRMALHHNPWSARARAGIGRVRVAQGRFSDAVPFLEGAYRLNRSEAVAELLESARRQAAGLSAG